MDIIRCFCHMTNKSINFLLENGYWCTFMKLDAKIVPRFNRIRVKSIFIPRCFTQYIMINVWICPSVKKEAFWRRFPYRNAGVNLLWILKNWIMRLFHLLSERVSQPNSPYNLLVLVPFQVPLIIRAAWYWARSIASMSGCKVTEESKGFIKGGIW